MAKFELQPGEQLILEGAMPYLKSRFQYVAGWAYLTDRRFVHTNNLRAQAVGGLAGALMKGRIDLEIPLEAIERVARSSHGRKHEPVIVITAAGGKDHRLVTSFDEWFVALDQTLSAHRATRLVEVEPGTWTALREG